MPRARQSRSLHLLHTGKEPEPGPTVLPLEWSRPPDVVSHDPAALREWNRLAGVTDWLTTADTALVTAYVIATSHHAQAVEELRRDGLIRDSKGASGPTRVKSAAWQLWRDSLSAINTTSAALGLSPRSREQISIPKRQDRDAADAQFSA